MCFWYSNHHHLQTSESKGLQSALQILSQWITKKLSTGRSDQRQHTQSCLCLRFSSITVCVVYAAARINIWTFASLVKNITALDIKTLQQVSAVKNEGTAFLTTTFFKELLSAHVKVIFSGCLKSVQLQWYYCRFIILNQTKNTCLHCQFKSKFSTYPTEIQSVNGKKNPHEIRFLQIHF